MNSNPSSHSHVPMKPSKAISIGQLFSKQPANYYQNPNSSLLLFSCDPVLGQLVRTALNHYSCEYFDSSYLCDAGELNNETTKQLIYDLSFREAKTIVLIGAEPELISGIQELCDQEIHPLTISYVSDQCSPVDTLNLDSIYLKELNIIGFQRQHILHTNHSINYFRLGEFRNNHSSIESPIRRSDIVYFNINSLRYSDSPGSILKNPSGFYAEEACSISRTIGMSERLKLFAISGWNENKDPDKITSSLVAQMVWYFWEGCHLKQLDQKMDRESLTQYLVELKNLDYIITFYKSENSGKWWFEEPLIDNEFSNQLIPCTYDEYLATVKDQIPRRILEMING